MKDANVPKSFVHASTGTYQVSALMRSEEIEPPHNLFVRMQDLIANFWPTDPENEDMPYEPKVPGLLFSQTPTRGEGPATRVYIFYDRLNYYASYQYDEASGMYCRSYAGYLMINRKTREPIMAANIIVQWVNHSYINNQASMPVIDLIGSGPVDVYFNGTCIHGYWERSSAQAPTEYFYSAEDGVERILLKPGKTFIQLFPLSGVTYEDANELGNITYSLDN